jgi:hypothetical protein
VRYREDNQQDLERARQLVRVWRGEHPQGTVDEMVAALIGQFRPDYEPVLRGVLAGQEMHGAKIVTGISITDGPRG